MTDLQNNKESKKPMKMGIYYDIVAGLLYVFLAIYLYTSPPESIRADIIQIVMTVFAFYGIFRVGRGIYRVTRK